MKRKSSRAVRQTTERQGESVRRPARADAITRPATEVKPNEAVFDEAIFSGGGGRSSFYDVDRKRLTELYEIERLPIYKIAAALGVWVGSIRQALKLHGIPPRRSLHYGRRYGGKHTAALGKLLIGETQEIECRIKNPDPILYRTAQQLGIKISIRHHRAGFCRVTRIDPANSRPAFEISRIDKKKLEKMYVDETLPLAEIAARLGIGIRRVREALNFYEIPARASNYRGGKHSSAFKKLPIGESVEVICRTKSPYSSLYESARRNGIKISLRSRGPGIFQVKRVG